MSFILSSSGATSCLGEPYVALSTSSGITVLPLKEWDSKDQHCNDAYTQQINIPHPFNVIWSENSAHLVIVTTDSIFLYKCVAETSSTNNFSWRWEISRSVDAPRNLLAFHAGYSHPLLSLEQVIHVESNEHNAGIGEVVVINLLCSLFQTFSVATPTIHPTLGTAQRMADTHYSHLSHSGRYLTTAQSFSSPSASTTTPRAVLGIRVYDLLDLWVLETPTEASYLDFKYADLGVDNAYSIETVPYTNSINSKNNTNTTSATADPLLWGVRQVQWKQSDRFTLAEDAYEIFFVANTIHTTATNTTSNANNTSRNNRYSIGIADRHGDYSPTVKSPYTPYTPYTPHTPMPTTSTSDVSVSIYSVSQQPDYENINILTMAYNAAIVAGQLNPSDEYNTNSIQTTTIPNTPHIHTAQSVARTTAVNLLLVVTLDTLCREISSDYSNAYTNYTTNTSTTSHRSILFAWVEASAGTAHHSRKHKESNTNTALWLSAVYSTNSTTNTDTKTTITNSTSTTVCDSDSNAYSVLLCGIQYENRANSCNDQKQYSYVPCYISNGGVSVSTVYPFSVLSSVRCVGSVGNGVSISGGSSDSSGSKHTVGVPIEVYMVHSSASTNTDSILFSNVSMSVHTTSTTSTDTTWSDGRELQLTLTDWRTHVVHDSNFSTGTSGPATNTITNTGSVDTIGTVNTTISTEHMLPSSTVRFTVIDTYSSGSLYRVIHNDSTDTNGNTSEIIDLSSALCVIERIITAASTTNTTTNATILYVLHTKADNTTHLNVWTHPAHTTHTVHTHTQRTIHNAHYYSTLPTIAYTSTSTAPANEYCTTLLPDPHFGLGIRIDVVQSRVVVSSFKRHPITNKAMNAQLKGEIAPGDEFISINGKMLRGLPLADVIHTIRSTVSEGGDKEVRLTMQRLLQGSGGGGEGSGSTSGSTSGDAKSTYSTSNSNIATLVTTTNTNNNTTSNNSTSNLPELHQVSSVSSINSVLSTTSLSDGLDNGGSNKYNNNTTSIGGNGDGNGSSGGVCVPLCSAWKFVREVSVGEGVVAADLCVVGSSSGGSSGSEDVGGDVFVVVLQQAVSGMHVVLSRVDSGSRFTLTVLSQTMYRSVYSSCANAIDTTPNYTIQLWNSNNDIKCTVSERQCNTTTSTDTSTITSDLMPIITVYDVSSTYFMSVQSVYDCIPVIDAHCTHGTTHSTRTAHAACILHTYPTSISTSTNAIHIHGREVAVTYRLHNFISTGTSIVPLYLHKSSAWSNTLVPLEAFPPLLHTLYASNPDTAANLNSMVLWLQRNTNSPNADSIGLIDALLEQYKCSALATTLLQYLRAYYTLLPITSNSNTVDTNTVAALDVNTHATRAITLSILLRTNNTSTNTNAPSTTSSTNTSSTTDTRHDAFILSGAAVANLLFGASNTSTTGTVSATADSTSMSRSATNQAVLLDLLVPQPTSSTSNASSTNNDTSTVADSIRALLTTITTPTPTTTTTNTTTTNTSDSNDNTYLNFTATTNTNNTPTTIDILAHLVSVHAALWVRDATPLSDIIYRHAMAAFRVHKSSIQIFLEMVLIGKEDTLLQLCKTDRSKSGKQLLALLTLDDTFVSDSARRKLQKNAFALMKLHRYRDAAAVFLLARPPFIKEACSVLGRQYNSPCMGLLVARMAELRVYGSGGSSSGSTGSSGSGGTSVNGTSTSSSGVPVPSGVEGYVLGPVGRQVLLGDVVPLFLSAVESSALRSVQTSLQHTAHTSTTNTNACTSLTGINAALLALVAALWLQDRAVVKSTLYSVLHRYSLVDCVSAAAAVEAKKGHETEHHVASQLLSVLSSVDWLLQIGTYLGAKHYNYVLCAVQTFVVQHSLHRAVLDTALYNTRIMRTYYIQCVRDNAFLRYSALCYTQYAEYVVQKEKMQLQSDSALVQDNTDASVSSANTLFTASSVYNNNTSDPNIASSVDSTSGSSTEYEDVMKRISRFQATNDTTAATTTTVPTNATTTATTSSCAGIADVPLVPSSPFLVPVPAAVPRSGGFNFASMSNRPSATGTTDAPGASSSGGSSGGNSGITLDGFDLPPASRRTAAGASASTIINNNTSNNATHSNIAPTTAAAASSAAAFDPFSFDFAPPVRHTRAARTAAAASNGRDGSATSTSNTDDTASVTNTNTNTTTTTAAASSAPGADNFDSANFGFDFAAPVRHTRASTNNNTTNTTNTSSSSPGASDVRVDGPPTNTSTTTTTAEASVAPVAKFNFASPSPHQPTTTTNTTHTTSITADPFAAFDAAPPVRHTRSSVRGVSSVGIGNVGGARSSNNSATVGTSSINSTISSDKEAQQTPVPAPAASSFNFANAAAPAPAYTATVTATITNHTDTTASPNTTAPARDIFSMDSSLDFLAPPTRHVRSHRPAITATATTTATASPSISGDSNAAPVAAVTAAHSGNSDSNRTSSANNTSDSVAVKEEEDLFSGMSVYNNSNYNTSYSNNTDANTSSTMNASGACEETASPALSFNFAAPLTIGTISTTNTANNTTTPTTAPSPAPPAVVVKSALDDFDFFAPPRATRRPNQENK